MQSSGALTPLFASQEAFLVGVAQGSATPAANPVYEFLENRVRRNACFLYALENSTTKDTSLINKTKLYNQINNTNR